MSPGLTVEYVQLSIRSFGVAPIELEGHGLEVGWDRRELVAKLFGLERNEAAARRAREAKSFAVAHQEDLAVEQPVVVILTGSHHVTKLANAAGFDANSPSGFKDEHPPRRRDLIFLCRKQGLIRRT